MPSATGGAAAAAVGTPAPDYIAHLTHVMFGHNNTTINLREFHLRPTFNGIYPMFILLYGTLVVGGVIANLGVLVHVARRRLYRDTSYCFIINMAVSDIIKACCVLPITLTVLLVQNWVFGSFMCYFLPMLQDIPMHVSTLTFVLIAFDRYKVTRDPMRPRLPAFVCAVGTWLLALVIVLPYPIYITYIDLGTYMQPKKAFEGVGICLFNLLDDMQEYMRGIFLVMYAAPMCTVAYLYVRATRELQTQSTSHATVTYEARSRDVHYSRSRTDSRSTADFRESRQDFGSEFSRGSYRGTANAPHRPPLRSAITAGVVGGRCSIGTAAPARHQQHRASSSCELYSSYADDDILELQDGEHREKRAYKFLAQSATAYGVCLCPLMVLRLARLAMVETYDNASQFDITYTMFVWLAFLPVVATPLLYVHWHVSRSTKERLRGYFRFSERKLRRSCEAAISASSMLEAEHAHITGQPSAASDVSGDGGAIGYQLQQHGTPLGHRGSSKSSCSRTSFQHCARTGSLSGARGSDASRLTETTTYQQDLSSS